MFATFVIFRIDLAQQIYIRQIYIPLIAMIAEKRLEGRWSVCLVRWSLTNVWLLLLNLWTRWNGLKDFKRSYFLIQRWIQMAWSHLDSLSGWRAHTQFSFPGQRWLPWPCLALKHIPGPIHQTVPIQSSDMKKVANLLFRKRLVIPHQTPCWFPFKMQLTSLPRIQWAPSAQYIVTKLQLKFWLL